MSDVRIGVIGAGSAGARHVAAYRKVPGVHITAILEPDARRGAPLAAEAAAQHFTELAEQFWDAVDAVSVCSPHALLAEYALAAITREKHLLLEKPMALTLADADAIIGAAERAGVVLMVGFVHRFRVEIAEAHRQIANGTIGKPTFGVEHMISGGNPTPGWIWQKSLAGGGVLLYNGIHGLDRLRWLMDSEATEVYARASTAVHDADVEDIVVATISYANGASASFVQHIAPYPLPAGWRSEIYGTQGAMIVAADQTVTVSDYHRQVTMNPDRDDRFLSEMREFIGALQERREPSVTGADGRAALATALALYESVESGNPVAIAATVQA